MEQATSRESGAVLTLKRGCGQRQRGNSVRASGRAGNLVRRREWCRRHGRRQSRGGGRVARASCLTCVRGCWMDCVNRAQRHTGRVSLMRAGPGRGGRGWDDWNGWSEGDDVAGDRGIEDGRGRSGRGVVDYGRQSESSTAGWGEVEYREGYEDEEDFLRSGEEWRPHQAAGERRFQSGGMGFETSSSQKKRKDMGGGGVRKRPQVIALTEFEARALLPWTTGSQFSYYFGDFDVWAPRFGITFAAALVAGQASPLLGSAAIVSFIAIPMLRAVQRNAPIKEYNYVGLWTMRVESCEVLDWSDPDFRLRATIPDSGSIRGNAPKPPGDGPAISSSVFRVSLSDDSGAIIDMEVPMQREFVEVRPGDEGVGIVVSDVASLDRFKCLRDVFLPDTGIWISEYPFIERSAFFRVLKSI